MLGYQSIYEKSMNGIKIISDGQAIISGGDLTAVNVYATNISGLITAPVQTNITSVGTLTSLNVSPGTSTLKAVTSDSIIQNSGGTLTQSGLGRIVQSSVTTGNQNIMSGMSINANNDIFFNSGTGKINQVLSTGTNTLATSTMNSNANLSMSGTGIISQSGSSTNALKATNFIGRVGIGGDFVQSSGANTLFDSSITNITQPGSSTLIQAIGGTGTNALNKTTITELIVTNAMTIPSGVTMPSATYNGDTSYINTAKIIQSGSTGINDFNGSTFNGNVSISGNLSMTGGAATSSLKTPTILGLTTLEGITQNSGTSSLRGLTCNQLDINSGYNQNMSGTSIISQSGSSSNIFKSSGFSGACTFANNITQSSGITILLDSTTGHLSLTTGKMVKFFNESGRKIILFDGNTATVYNHFGFSVESGILRYNVEANSQAHVFSSGNGGNGTAFLEMMRVNGTGLGIGTTPSYKLHVLGSTMLNGVNLFTTSLNGISPTIFNYLLNVSSDIQNQLTTNSTTGTSNNAAITALQTKTTNQSYSAGITTFTGTVAGINSTMIGLGLCDNTSDVNKPISTLTQSALDLKGTLGALNNWNSTNNFNSTYYNGEWNWQGGSTFPTTTTGGTLGLSLYRNKNVGSGEVDFLCRGNLGSGGFSFWTSSNSLAPYNLLDITYTGASFKQDVSIAGNFSYSGVMTSSNHTGLITGVNEVLTGYLNVSGLITGTNQNLSGALNVAGNIDGNGTLDILGTTILRGQTQVTNGGFAVLSGVNVFFDKVNCKADLDVTGSANLGGTLTLDLNTIGNNTTSGTLNVTGVSTLSKLYYKGIVGAYLIDGGINTQHYPIYNSIPDFTNFYSRSASNSGLTVSIGTVLTSSYSRDNIDDVYLVMPNFRLVVYPNANYGGTVVLDMTNTGNVPVYAVPTSVNVATSCKIYCNGFEIV